ncbi:transposase, MuDR, MULE transposase domain protein [Tanacetum coccineum]
MDRMQKSANWKVYRIHQGKVYQVDDRQKVHRVDLPTRSFTCRKWQLLGIPCGHVIAVGRVMGCTDCSDMALVVKPPNMNFPKAGRPKNTARIKSQDEEPIQLRSSRCGVLGHTRASCHEPIPNYQKSTQSSWKRSRQSRPESNIHNNFGGRSQQCEAAYSNNHGRSQEYAQAYNNMIGRSQDYEPAYTNMIGRSQEYEQAYNNMIGRSQEYELAYTNNHEKSQQYEPVYNNMIRRSQEYSPAYNNHNRRSQEYEVAYNNINFNGMTFAFNQFNFGQTSQQTDSSMPFTWDPINLAEA